MSRADELVKRYRNEGAEFVATLATAFTFADAEIEFDDVFCGDSTLSIEEYDELRTGYQPYEEGYVIVCPDGSCIGGYSLGDSEGSYELITADSLEEFAIVHSRAVSGKE